MERWERVAHEAGERGDRLAEELAGAKAMWVEELKHLTERIAVLEAYKAQAEPSAPPGIDPDVESGLGMRIGLVEAAIEKFQVKELEEKIANAENLWAVREQDFQKQQQLQQQLMKPWLQLMTNSKQLRPMRRAVSFQADMACLYRLHLQCRLPFRLLSTILPSPMRT